MSKTSKSHQTAATHGCLTNMLSLCSETNCSHMQLFLRNIITNQKRSCKHLQQWMWNEKNVQTERPKVGQLLNSPRVLQFPSRSQKTCKYVDWLEELKRPSQSPDLNPLNPNALKFFYTKLSSKHVFYGPLFVHRNIVMLAQEMSFSKPLPQCEKHNVI